MKIFKCVCNEEFESFKDFAHHAKDCVKFQMKQDREARLKNENELNLSE